MADEKPTRGIRTVQGEVVRTDAPGHPSPVRRTLYRLISRLSTIPLFNRMSKRSLDSATEVIKAQTNLGDALIEHQLGADRLSDMPTIVATAHAERKAKRYEAETGLSKAEAAHEERFKDKQISLQLKDQELKRNKIADIDLDIQTHNKLKEFEALRKIEEPPKKKRVVDPIHHKVKEEVKRAKTESKVEKDIEGLSEAAKKRIRKKLRIDQEIQREEEGR